MMVPVNLYQWLLTFKEILGRGNTMCKLAFQYFMLNMMKCLDFEFWCINTVEKQGIMQNYYREI